jgi:hypothetical protein
MGSPERESHPLRSQDRRCDARYLPIITLQKSGVARPLSGVTIGPPIMIRGRCQTNLSQTLGFAVASQLDG